MTAASYFLAQQVHKQIFPNLNPAIPYALAEIEKAAGIRGIPFEGKTVVLKEQVGWRADG
jgi:hypothetical protein